MELLDAEQEAQCPAAVLGVTNSEQLGAARGTSGLPKTDVPGTGPEQSRPP